MSEAAPNIFISHSSRDRRIAETICRGLESRGLRCWLASRDVAGGDNFQAAVVRAIRSAKVMLLVFTTNTNNSDEIKKELVLASQNRLVVIPLRVEDVAPDDAFAYELATRQWIDMFDDWERGMDRVASRIEAVLPSATAASAAPATAAPPPSAPRGGIAGKLIVLASAALLAMAAVAFFVLRPHDQPTPPASPPTPVAATPPTIEHPPAVTPTPTPPPPDQHPARRSGEADEAVKNGDAAFERKDYAEALRSWRPAAEQGNAKAQLGLGMLYQEGWGVTEDYAESLRWFRLAAAQGEPRAQNRIGIFYARGLGVSQDPAEAMRWYRLAADQGLAAAQLNVGALYHRGNGVQQDYAEAMRWYRKAADQGLPLAEFEVGMLYAQGLGVAQDMVQARAWMSKAAAEGNGRARQWLANH